MLVGGFQFHRALGDQILQMMTVLIQFGGDLLALGDVLKGAGEVRVCAMLHPADAAQLRAEAPARGGNHFAFHDEGRTAFPGFPQLLADSGQVLGRVISQAPLQRNGRLVQGVFHQAIHFLGPYQHIGDWISLPAAHAGDGLAFPEEHRRFPQCRFGPLLFGDVAPDAEEIIPVMQADHPHGDLHIEDASVLAAVSGLEAGAAGDEQPCA